VTLTAEQQTKIRETVLARSDVPRLNTINFALTVGTTVPNTVHVVEVPETLIAIYPEWREDMYFVVRDDIVIVDHSHRIVALIPVGSAGARASAPAQGSSVAINLSRDEIRQVQIMLNEKGFNVGEPDGILGERTRAALMQFQQRQGFHATGQIDQQTMPALGVSKGGGQQGQQGQPSSTGQGGSTMNQPKASQGNAAGQKGSQGAAQPSTAGQGSQPTQQPSTNPPAARQGTGTSGQSPGKTPQNMNPNAGSNAAPERQAK
jgi:peptidoglycan hydrolase-like protein with peptidoglycan-binding domain